MNSFITYASLIVSIIGSIVIPLAVNKQNKNREKTHLKVKLAISSLGEDEEYRYQYVIINNSQRAAYITEIFIEIYEFNKFIERIKYISQVESSDDDDKFNRNILPNTSLTGWLPESEEYANQNIFIRLSIYTQDLEIFKSNFFDPRTSVQLTEFKVKKLKRDSSKSNIQ